MTTKAAAEPSREDLIALADAGLRHADGLESQLALPDWRPGRAHIEQSRNSIKKLADALRRLSAPAGNDGAVPSSPGSADILKEGIEILENLRVSIRKHGNYSAEATVTFIDQALQCFRIVDVAQAKPGPVERCLTCGRGDAEYKACGWDCVDPWHADAHLRAKSVALPSTDHQPGCQSGDFGPCDCALSSTHGNTP